MNYKAIFNVLAKVMLITAVALLIPMIVGICYAENNFLSFLLPSLGLMAIAIPVLIFVKTEDKKIYAKEGLVIVSVSWIMMSLVGALPYVISGAIPNYIDALFETVSGFTTTGSSILSPDQIDNLARGITFWRSFTNFIGGMGVLVFFLAILPANSGAIHIYRAEAPGPSAGNVVTKIKFTARVLYLIYIGMTLILTVLLLLGGMDFFDAICQAFATAGTGGFSTKGAGIAAFNSIYIEMVLAVFMFLFAINFNVFFLILVGHIGKAIKSEELRVYFIIVVVSTLAIAVDLTIKGLNFAEAIRYSFFQTASFSSSTGFNTTDFTTWPVFSQIILILLMIVGACGGSTGGGLKVSRVCILTKAGYQSAKKISSPRAVLTTRFEGKVLDDQAIGNVKSYFFWWFAILLLGTLLVSITSSGSFYTDFTSSLSAISNTGPILTTFQFGDYNTFAKIVLSLLMLLGRLEIFPILILFSRRTWRKA